MPLSGTQVSAMGLHLLGSSSYFDKTWETMMSSKVEEVVVI